MGDEKDIVERVAARYLGLIDAELPGRLEGLYLIGSVAYGDFWPGSSDIDFVAVGSQPFRGDDLAALRRVHEQLAGDHHRPHFDGSYSTWDDLRAHPERLGAIPSSHEGRVTELRPGVIEWGTLRTGRPMRGDPLEDTWYEPEAIREHSRRNLVEYWREKWLRQQRSPSPAAAMSLADWGVHWGVLGVSRLHLSIATGEVASKSHGGEYALDTFDSRWERIVHEALRIRRQEGRRSLYRTPLARRRDALAFQEHVIADGIALPPHRGAAAPSPAVGDDDATAGTAP